MNYLSSHNPSNQRVLVRLDLDLPEKDGQFDTTRMEVGFATLAYLRDHGASHVTVIAHRGHDPEHTSEFSLEPIAKVMYQMLGKLDSFAGTSEAEIRNWLDIKENLRFDPREEEGSAEFAQELAAGYDIFVNDAFATAHRKHTSIVFLPKVLPTFLGLQFEKELAALKKVTDSPERPYVFVLGGAKLETKLPLLEKIAPLVDQVLLGGKLAVEAKAQNFSHPKVKIAELTEDTLDICEASAQEFTHSISQAKTVVWNGPMGKFEDSEHMRGTQVIAEAIAENSGYTLLGGGDTEAAVTILGIDEKKYSHVSSGGGALMHYLTFGTLPALKVL